MRIAIASGKGGTGKTTVVANLAVHLKNSKHSVAVADCDVEEPNLHLFLNPHLDIEKTAVVPIPEVDNELCTGDDCGLCAQLCRFKSLILMAGEVMVFPELCHGCGLCTLACPEKAITEGSRAIGVVRSGKANCIPFTEGEMKIGEAMAPPLIEEVKAASPQCDIELIDCPPGTSCPVIKALDGVDFAVLVTEPTPFGLHDLDLAVLTLRQLRIPFGVVINRDGMGNSCVHDYLNREKITLLGAIPHSLKAAQAYSKGLLHVGNVEGFDDHYAKLWENIQQSIGEARS
ncbi:ATP-binding protein [Desulfovibrio ferrophilus]|uniref:Cobyrinic acid ac-diamide synthase n=1 Tax=Desulfovibrio ferrophilus TaxID=241368 RepID=A0A2Z6AW13_9BACT|nr:ATP-binding protein [Desulfovibrio ferrophilus]BBD07421.1 cobyrinic acid ac-diamide synthase [Desulfovibrio ferrophilus]